MADIQIKIDNVGDNRWLAYLDGAKECNAYGRTAEEAKDELINFLRKIQASMGLYAQFIQPGDICFDIGANIGERTAYFVKLGATVVAVDPQPSCCRQLEKSFADNNQVTVINKALGAKTGTADMMVCSSSAISSMSPEWINAVKESGRFAEFDWDQKITVEVTTLDQLIDAFGKPSFIKIDVEGFEYNVINGLSQPVGALSFEYTPETKDISMKCIAHLAALGDVVFNYCLGENMRFELAEWLSPTKMMAEIDAMKVDTKVWGDIYARFIA